MEEKKSITERGTGDYNLLELLRKDVAEIPLLSPEEEIAIARRAVAGDQDAIDLLVESNIKLVIYIALWYRTLPIMDLVSAGCVRLLHAARTFDPERGVRFITYAWPVIENGIRKCIKDHYRNRHDSLDEPVGDEEDGATRKDFITVEAGSSLTIRPSDKRRNKRAFHVAGCPAWSEKADNYRVWRALLALNARERKIIALRYWRGLSRDETAAKVYISATRVMQIENGALIKMRWAIIGEPGRENNGVLHAARLAGCGA